VKIRLQLAALLVCLLPLAGCFVFSTQPLYTADDRAYDPALIGAWVSSDEDCQPAKASGENPPCSFVFATEVRGGQKGYRITVTDEHRKRNTFRARLVEIVRARFLDVTPIEAPDLTAPSKNMHSFWKVVRRTNTLKLVPLNEDWLRGELKAGRIKLAHREGNALVLTGSTAELRAFITAHANDSRAWPETDSTPLTKRK
jgi:hypothetical protein